MATKYNSTFTPVFYKTALKDTKSVTMTYADADLGQSNHGSSEAFKYDPLGYPLKSTQQLNVDWSRFENHCFFSSAEVKVNEAFGKIINGYPFDGTKKEVESFNDTLTGFEKWILDQFPTWAGALHFSGTQPGEDPSNGFSEGLGNWIAVKDKSGNLYPELSKNKKGDTIINPGDEDSLSIEFLLNLPSTVNDVQVVFQKMSNQVHGFTFHLKNSTSIDKVTAVFTVSSGSNRNYVEAEVTKGKYNHICVTLDKTVSQKQSLSFFINEELKSTSKYFVNFGRISEANNSDFIIGSGSSFYSDTTLVTPVQTLSGTIDDFKVFHSVRTTAQQKLHLKRGVYTTPDLKLYYRFNEPSGSISPDSIVLDSSGNSLHSTIENFDFDRRVNVANDSGNLMTDELAAFKVVLFPSYSDVTTLNSSLLSEAKNYDRANPNTIFKLIPPHYLQEGAEQQGFENFDGNGGAPFGGNGIPGTGQKGSVQVILTFLYIWAKFFDEIKLYLDSFGNLKTVSYDTDDTIPDNFLEDMVRNYGFYLPRFFNHATVEQFAEGKNIEGLSDISTPLKKIQSIITRRVLVNMQEIMRSKGTRHSIKTFLRSIGMDPENSIRIREYGGPRTKQLGTTREKRMESLGLVQFTTSSFVITPFLSSSRVEPGYPLPRGSFVTSQGKVIGTDRESDGLLTSGSWNIEAVFKMPPQQLNLIQNEDGNQSLMRLITTGSYAYAKPGLIANVVATQQSDFPSKTATIQAYIRPSTSTTAEVLSMSIALPGKGFFDGDKWNVSLGCFRNDQINSDVSSSYYLRIAKTESGDLTDIYTTSSYFNENVSGHINVFRSTNSSYNASGSAICIGNSSIPSRIGESFLNDTLSSDEIARTTEYVGWASNLRFWSKGMSIDEWKEHVRNPKSVGVSEPLKNYNFTTKLSGSFEKLRIDSLQKQPIKNSDSSGSISFVDYSLNFNEKYTEGTGFNPSAQVIIGDVFDYTYLSPMFDEMSTDDKIRIRSFQNQLMLAESPDAVLAPSFSSNSTFVSEEPQDDTRLSIEFSMIDSLDKDIISMFSSLDFIGDAIGSPELMFSPDYPTLDNLRDVYFMRLSGKPDFRKFLEFYRWFDISMSSFIEQLIPYKTNYKGTNYVVESHVLERHKNSYKHSDNYLGRRLVIQDNLLVQQVVGKLNKY